MGYTVDHLRPNTFFTEGNALHFFGATKPAAWSRFKAAALLVFMIAANFSFYSLASEHCAVSFSGNGPFADVDLWQGPPIPKDPDKKQWAEFLLAYRQFLNDRLMALRKHADFADIHHAQVVAIKAILQLLDDVEKLKEKGFWTDVNTAAALVMLPTIPQTLGISAFDSYEILPGLIPPMNSANFVQPMDPLCEFLKDINQKLATPIRLFPDLVNLFGARPERLNVKFQQRAPDEMMTLLLHFEQLLDAVKGWGNNTSFGNLLKRELYGYDSSEQGAIPTIYFNVLIDMLAKQKKVLYKTARQRLSVDEIRDLVAKNITSTEHIWHKSDVIDGLLGLREVEFNRLGESEGSDKYAGEATWPGDSSLDLLTPYKMFDAIQAQLHIPRGARFVDLGCGPGRGGIALGTVRPDILFFGYDVYRERIEEGKIAAATLGLRNAHFSQQNLSEPNFRPTVADYYFLFNPFKERTMKKVYEDLWQISRQHPIYVLLSPNTPLPDGHWLEFVKVIDVGYKVVVYQSVN